MTTVFDNPLVRSMLFYPRAALPKYTDKLTGPISDGTIAIDETVALGYRLYCQGYRSPLIVYFHGNGEIAADHDETAELYARIGLSLLVIDYRGYGWSTGQANVSTLLADMTPVYKALPGLLQHHQIANAPLFLMGRSLGSACAIHLAHEHRDSFHGLIIESGFTELLKLSIVPSALGKVTEPINNVQKMRDIQLPLLVIHGEKDTLIPVDHGQALFDASPAAVKRIIRIEAAGHNDLLRYGISTYFEALKQFVGDSGVKLDDPKS